MKTVDGERTGAIALINTYAITYPVGGSGGSRGCDHGAMAPPWTLEGALFRLPKEALDHPKECSVLQASRSLLGPCKGLLGAPANSFSY